MFETTAAGGYGQGEWNQGEWNHGEWNQGEDEWGRRRRWRRRRRWGYDDDDNEFAPGGPQLEDEYEDEDAGEEQFLPIIAAGLKLLPTILGGLGSLAGGRQTEYEEGEEGEAEEELLGKLLSKFLGEAEYQQEAPLSPAQEAELAGRLLEVSDEAELKQVLGRVVNAVGSVAQGVRSAANSPQGRALVEALTPVARTVVPGAGQCAGEVFETQAAGLSQEQQAYESARQAVRLAASAAQHVAAAPPGAPPEVVGELGIFRAASRLARPLFGRALRAFSPLARRHYGGLRGGYRYGRPYRGYSGGYRRPGYLGYRGRRYWGYRRPGYWGGYRYPYGNPPGYVEGPPEPMAPPPAISPAPSPEPPGPPSAGYRWVAVPIGAPPPTAVPSEPAPEPAPPAAGPPSEPVPAGQPGQSEWGQSEWGQGEYGQGEYVPGEWGQGEWDQHEYVPGEWAQGEYQPGEYQPGEYEQGPGMNGSGGDGTGGRWVRRNGKIVLLGA